MITTGQNMRNGDPTQPKTNPSINPDKNIPTKPDRNPDHTKILPGVNEPEKIDPTRIDPPKNFRPELEILKATFLNLVFCIASFAFTLSMISCAAPEKTKDSVEIANDNNDSKFTQPKESDAQFLVSAAEINLAEIQLGQIAQNNGSLDMVKELGKMMETEHSKSLKDLTILAAKKQITMPLAPTDQEQIAYKALSEKIGNDFDTEYCNMMVKGHKDAIDKFEIASTEAADKDVRFWAASMLPGLRVHLEHSLVCQKACEKITVNSKL